MKERCVKDGLDPEENLVPQFRAHLNRGVYSIFTRIKDLEDLQNLFISGKI